MEGEKTIDKTIDRTKPLNDDQLEQVSGGGNGRGNDRSEPLKDPTFTVTKRRPGY